MLASPHCLVDQCFLALFADMGIVLQAELTAMLSIFKRQDHELSESSKQLLALRPPPTTVAGFEALRTLPDKLEPNGGSKVQQAVLQACAMRTALSLQACQVKHKRRSALPCWNAGIQHRACGHA